MEETCGLMLPQASRSTYHQLQHATEELILKTRYNDGLHKHFHISRDLGIAIKWAPSKILILTAT